MAYRLAAIAGIIYVAAVVRLVYRRYGAGADARYRTTMPEVLWLVTIWGVAGGIAMYLNPDTQHMWNPRIAVVDKLLYWAIGLLFAGVIIRTLFTVRPIVKKLLTALCGVILAGLADYALITVFGTR